MPQHNLLAVYQEDVRDELVRFACSKLHDASAAEDVVQDVLLSVWVRSNDVREITRGYLFTAVARRSLNWLRDQRQRAVVHDRLQHNVAVHVHPVVDTLIEAGEVRELLDRLPGRARQIATLHWVEQRSTAEIARMLGISVKGVEKRVTFARQRLRTLLVVD